MTSILQRLSTILFILILLAPHAAFAEEARLTNIIVTNSRDDLLVYLKVEGAFTEKMKKVTLNGVPTTFLEIPNAYGHDAFLLPSETLSDAVTSFLANVQRCVREGRCKENVR